MAGSFASEGFAWWVAAPSVAAQVPQPNLRNEPAPVPPAPEPPAPGPPSEAAREANRRTRRHLERLRSLGVLSSIGHPDFEFYEFKYLEWVHKTLTVDWALVQGGSLDGQAKTKWMEIVRTLELDKKACVDLYLLAQQGRPGRAEANEILWFLLSEAGLEEPYRDLSNICTHKVGEARYYLDRPGRTHPSWDESEPWVWSRYDDPRNPNFCSSVVPPGPFKLQRGDRGIPVNPPGLWIPVPRPKGPPPLAARPKTL